ncbi:protein TIFY 10A-like isoform X2 [Primulina eburnea]|uniref:protein TIFY 10A-like isoform X2 n=1 Tax=Primulina eburnea TaxID=1245227 RepID=UPI003C6C9C64
MGSSEVVDSSGKRKNFSQTCSLLSQFLKEKGSFGELGLGLSQNLEHKVVPTGTMNLLPIIEKSDKNQALPNPDFNPSNLTSPSNMFHHLANGGRRETMKRSDISGTKLVAESAPLTIFYAGQVIVFNDFPADKANEIMMLASKSSSAAAENHHFSTSSPPVTPQSPTESATSFPNVVPSLAVQKLAHRTPPPPPPQFSSGNLNVYKVIYGKDLANTRSDTTFLFQIYLSQEKIHWPDSWKREKLELLLLNHTQQESRRRHRRQLKSTKHG